MQPYRTRKPVAMLLAGLVVATLARDGKTAEPPPQSLGCAEPAHRQFDFWLGNWEVFTPDGAKAGDNLIETVAAGCALSESWAGRKGFTGRSLNSFDKADGKWHQTWVDSTGGRLDLAGALEGNTMVLSQTVADGDTAGGTLTHRITWTPNGDGSVRQHWQTSKDRGKTWTTAFDGRYVKKKP